MHNYNDLLFLVKKAAIEAVEARNPTALLFGKVDSMSPLRVTVEQRLTLSDMQLVIGDKVREDLAVGDTVIVLRMQGGQRFLIIDKVAA